VDVHLDDVAASLLRIGGDTLGPRMFLEVLSKPGLPSASSRSMVDLLAATLPIPAPHRPARIREARQWASEALLHAKALGISVVRLRDPDAYPRLLRCIPDPPIVLWGLGQLDCLHQPIVSVVGSRNATPVGLAIAQRLGRGLAEAGVVVASGLARGCDAAAHRGALAGGGQTIAVLGSGVDVIYPAGHATLAASIQAAGVVLSEFPPGMPPLPSHFPLRNRIISGLSRAVVVVEASELSGSLITAKAALEQGRDVLAVPGNPASGCYRGSHALIKDGARLVETVEDILEELNWRSPSTGRDSSPAKCLPGDGLLASVGPGEAVTVDDLAARTGRPAGELMADLASLELAGKLSRLPGGCFTRID